MFDVVLVKISKQNLKKYESRFLDPQKNNWYPLEPILLESIKSFFLERKINSKIFDQLLDNLTTIDLIKKINKINPKLVIIDINEFYLDELILFKKIHSGTSIILIGNFAELAKEKLLKDYNFIDGIVIGDYESSCYNYFVSLNSKKKVNNVFYRNFYKKCKYLELDNLPFAKREYINKNYDFAIPIFGSRGCAYANCNFCQTAAVIKKSRCENISFKSIPKIISEIKEIVRTYNKNNFTFIDDCFFDYINIDNRITELTTQIKKNNLSISFLLNMRIDQVNFSRLKKLKEAGLWGIYLGIEGYNQNYLNFLNKNISKPKIMSSISICEKLGIKIIAGYIPFYREGNYKCIKENINFIKQIPGYQPGLFINILTPLYGTFYYDSFYSKSKNLDFKDKKVALLYQYLEKYDFYLKNNKEYNDLIDNKIFTKALEEKYKKKHFDFVNYIFNKIEDNNDN